jgi:nitrogen fixation protein NifB
MTLGAADSDASILVAVATQGGGRINQHFGHAKEFQVYQASSAGVTIIGHRKVDDAYCLSGFGDDASLDHLIRILEGIDIVLCAKIGECPKKELQRAGIRVSAEWAYEYIESAISSHYAREYGAAPQALRA